MKIHGTDDIVLFHIAIKIDIQIVDDGVLMQVLELVPEFYPFKFRFELTLYCSNALFF